MEGDIMKKRVLVIALALFFVLQIQAQTSGTLSISVTTSSTGGNYAPRNIVAIWIEDGSGKFVKTLLAYANTRITHLNTWETSSATSGTAYNRVDAITGATQSSHATRTCSWNSTDFSGKLVVDGDYKVRMELTDKNSTGNIASFTFVKGPNTQKLTPVNVPSFASISLNWSNGVTGIFPETAKVIPVVRPNPGNGQFWVTGDQVKSIVVRSLSGKVVLKGNVPSFDLTDFPNGLYFVTIVTNDETFVRKVIKN